MDKLPLAYESDLGSILKIMEVLHKIENNELLPIIFLDNKEEPRLRYSIDWCDNGDLGLWIEEL